MEKILVYLPTLNVGGAESVTANIMNILALKSKNIYLVTNDSSGELANRIGKSINIIDLKSKNKLVSFIKILKLIKEIKPGVIYSTLFRTHILLAVAKAFSGTSAVFIFRSPNSPKRLHQYNQLNWINKKLIAFSYKCCDLIIAQTPEMLEEISEYYNIELNKIKVLINPVDYLHIDKCVSESLNPFNEQNYNIVASGRITEQKGFDLLIDAMYRVLKEKPNARLFIIGADVIDLKKSLELKVKELRLEEQVEFIGFVSNPYIFYKYCDLFVSSSRWEGLPNTILECRYLKKKVVATQSVPFIHQLINDGNDGIIVPETTSKSIADSIIKSFKLGEVDIRTNQIPSDSLEDIFRS